MEIDGAMSDFNELLDAIRARPTLCLSEASLTYLWVFLMGYEIALGQHQIPKYANSPLDVNFLRHVSRRTDGKPVGARGYHTMILQHVGGDEVEALALFWQLLDEFRALPKPESIQNS